MIRIRGTILLALFLCGFSAVAFAQPPVAPPPRPVPTTPAELIVGRWKMTKHSLLRRITSNRSIIYTAPMRYEVIDHDLGNKSLVRGSYKIEGLSLYETPDGDTPGDPGGAVEFRITKLTREMMILSGRGRFDGQTSQYVRLQNESAD